MRVRYIVVAVGLLALLGGLAGIKAAQIRSLISFGEAAAQAGPPPEIIATSPVKEETWLEHLYSVGTIASNRGVKVSTEVPGVVRVIKFDSGQKVRKGQILVELDRGVELADLASARASEDLARLSAERARALFQGHALPKAQLDSAESGLATASARVASLEAQIAHKIVRAPFAGRVGIRLVNVGQYLNPGTPITELESTEQNFVDFTLPQQQIDRLRVGMPVRINEGLPGRQGEATIAAIAPLVDPVTRSGEVRATVDEMETLMTPGMFVNVTVILPTKRQVTVIPTTALVHAPYGDSVYLVEPRQEKNGAPMKSREGKTALVAQQQFVKAGETRGDFVEILEGVKAGKEVVSQGAFKLHNGAPVEVNNEVSLRPQLSPHLGNH